MVARLGTSGPRCARRAPKRLARLDNGAIDMQLKRTVSSNCFQVSGANEL